MNIKHVWKIAALTGGVALFGFGASVGAVVKVGNSKATITFEEPKDAPDVLDPTELTPPYEPGEGDPSDDGKTGDTGALTLDFVSSLDFGPQSISSVEQKYESTILRPFIQVSDRRGTGAGWQVTAKLGEFSNAALEPSLKGAFITLANGEAVSPGDTPAPTPVNPVILVSGASEGIIMEATDGQGQGSWINRWFPKEPEDPTKNNSVTLTVPAGVASAGSHIATIQWTLTDAPQ